MLYPKLFTTLKTYSRQDFVSDLIAGVIVGIVALPLAIAFAIASGVSPERGLITAVVAGFIISAFGGSRVQIGGPTGAFVVIVYAIVQKYGFDGLLVANLMAGVILIIMGFARFGGVIKFIPYPVTVGFTSGIALIIFSSQIKDFLGLQMGNVPADFLEKYSAYFEHIGSTNYYALIVGALCIAIIQGWKKITRKIPGSLIALIVCTAVVHIFHWPVETIGSRFGEIPHTLPAPTLPKLSFNLIRQMIPSATTIAILAGIESLLSAVVSDGMIGGRHRSNMELVAQGLANIASPLFGGIPAAGAIARTTTNVHTGGRTPVAGIIHALTLLIIMFFLGKWASLIPLSCLAGILIVVAYHMSEWHSFSMMLRSPRSDVVVLLTTFGLTVLVDLTMAIQIGMVLAAFLFMHRMSMVTNVGVITREMKDEEDRDDPNAIDKRAVPEGVEVYEINGPFFFGASYKFMEAMRIVSGKPPKVRIIRMRYVNTVDATGMHVVREEFKNSRKKGIAFLISDIHAQPLFAFEQAGLLELIGEDNVFGNIDDALNKAREILSLPETPRPGPFVPSVKREGA